jgi:heat shock protein 5
VYFGREPVRGDMGSDEAVVHGASLLASYLTDEYIPMGYPVDISLLTLGIETSGGFMARIIPRHTVIPTRKIQNFSTVTDNQPTAFIRVFQGERPMAKDNHLLGELILADIPPAPRGVPQIEVTFEIGPDRGLKISVNTGTGG